MSVQSVALASLTAIYTDSEGEDGVDDDFQENSNTPKGSAPQYDQSGQSQDFNSPKSGSSTSNSPIITSNISGKSNNNLPNLPTVSSDESSKMQRLVSYFDDTVVSDDEGTTAQTAEAEPDFNGPALDTVEQQQSPNRPGDLLSDGEADAYGVVIPPEPPGQCPADVQKKIANLYMEMQYAHKDMNAYIQRRKDFRNPSIYEKLIQFCNINELGTNYPPDRFDPFKWNKDSYYDELAKVQKIEMEKLEKARKEKSKIEILTGTAKRPNTTAVTAEEDAKKRKSKWDQVISNPAAATTTNTKPGVISQPVITTLTSTVTGTRATVISAFGSLPKKRL